MKSTSRQLVVLQSFPDPRPTTNPYIVMLYRALRAADGVRVLTFTWRRALLGHYDVFHTHWPEILVTSPSRSKKLVRQVFFAVLLLRLRLTRTPLVRTVHNLELPEGISLLERLLLLWADRWTTLRIVINTTTQLPGGQPYATVLHGHYRDWYCSSPAARPAPGQIGYFGLIRRYKNVEGLVRAFHAVQDASLSLRVGGKPSSSALAQQLVVASAGDPRISFHLEFLSDAELVELVTSSELVVLPYREMHNSGGALAALSLDRPVLLPDNRVNRRLRDEVGPGWIFLYAGELDPEDITAALTASRCPRSTHPDLSARGWEQAAAQHVAAYRKAVDLVRDAPAVQLSRPYSA